VFGFCDVRQRHLPNDYFQQALSVFIISRHRQAELNMGGDIVLGDAYHHGMHHFIRSITCAAQGRKTLSCGVARIF